MKRKSYVNLILLAFLILAFNPVGFSKDAIMESIWADTSVRIDGADGEWKGTSFGTDDKTETGFAFKNDAENLYVFFTFNNPEFLSTIKDTGMTLWLNPEGKKKEKYGVNFKSKQVSADVLIAMMEKQRGPLSDADKVKIKSKPHYNLYQSQIIDKKEKNLTAEALAGVIKAPVFRKKEKDNVMTYEFQISLRVLERLSTGLKMKPGQGVKIGFQWGGMTEKMRDSAMQRGATRNPGAYSPESLSDMYTQGEDGAGTARRAPRSSLNRIRSPKKYSFWVDVKLAQENE